MKTHLTYAIVAVGALALSPSAFAQSFNFTVSTSTGPGAVLPSESYGAAAGQAGYWNSHVGTINAGQSVSLLDLNGTDTDVSFTSSSQFFALSGTLNLVGASPDDLGLLAGNWDISGSAGLADQATFTFTGLASGMYDIYTYALSPSSATQFTRVNVNAPAQDGEPGVQVVGGAFGGNLELGITHSLHQAIQVTDGTLVINADSVNFGQIAGFQIQMIPAPGALALLGVAGLATRRRRR